jgi:intracellular multiplication protein IcmO
MALQRKYQQDINVFIRDTRRPWLRFKSALLEPDTSIFVGIAVAACMIYMTYLVELVMLVGVWLLMIMLMTQKSAGLSLRMPMSSGRLDPKEVHPVTKKAQKAKGLVFLGNDQDSGDEIWLTDPQARTHMIVFGTTGSGKTEFLLSLVYNALIHGSGFIYVDGKADTSLYAKIYSMARHVGREDDVRVINFQTGARDIYGAQSSKMTNTLNPFASGSSGMLTQLIVSLMSSGGGGGNSDMWEGRAIAFASGLMTPLVYLRDIGELQLDVGTVRNYFSLDKLEKLAWQEYRDDPKFMALVEGLQAYLKSLAGYNVQSQGKQPESAREQHGYIEMQLTRTFNSLSDTYGHIMRTQLPEIDFTDVFLNRRILVVLLPALEKSPQELTNLGKIVVASLKATMATGLGSQIEGDRVDIIDAKPTNSPAPFMCVLDEYGYYTVKGFAVIPAQARSLGFMAIFAGQDYPGFAKSDENEAKSTLGNTNTRLVGKLECTETYRKFSELSGHAYITRVNRFERQHGDFTHSWKGDDATVEKFDRVAFEDLKGQENGEWHLWFGSDILRVKSFYANPKQVRQLRVNHLVSVARPLRSEIRALRRIGNKYDQILARPRGFAEVINHFPTSDFVEISEGIESHKTAYKDPVKRSLASIALYAECRRIREETARDSNAERAIARRAGQSAMGLNSMDGLAVDPQFDEDQAEFERIDDPAPARARVPSDVRNDRVPAFTPASPPPPSPDEFDDTDSPGTESEDGQPSGSGKSPMDPSWYDFNQHPEDISDLNDAGKARTQEVNELGEPVGGPADLDLPVDVELPDVENKVDGNGTDRVPVDFDDVDLPSEIGGDVAFDAGDAGDATVDSEEVVDIEELPSDSGIDSGPDGELVDAGDGSVPEEPGLAEADPEAYAQLERDSLGGQDWSADPRFGATPAQRSQIFILDPNEMDGFEGGSVFGLALPKAGNEGETNPPKRLPNQGVLRRDLTEDSIARIEKRIGKTDNDAAQNAAMVSREIGEATRYPITKPVGPVTPAGFKEVAERLSSALDLPSFLNMGDPREDKRGKGR